MSQRSMRNTLIRKRKKKQAVSRPKVTRIQGNTPRVRSRLKKEAGKARAAAAAQSAG